MVGGGVTCSACSGKSPRILMGGQEDAPQLRMNRMRGSK